MPEIPPTFPTLSNYFLFRAESVDTTLLASVLSFLSCMSSVIWSLVVVVVVSPVMLAMLAPLSVCYYWLQVRVRLFSCLGRAVCLQLHTLRAQVLRAWGWPRYQCCRSKGCPHVCALLCRQKCRAPSMPSVRSCAQTRYVRSSREIKRLDSLAMSPIFTQFAETLQARKFWPCCTTFAPVMVPFDRLWVASFSGWTAGRCAASSPSLPRRCRQGCSVLLGSPVGWVRSCWPACFAILHSPLSSMRLSHPQGLVTVRAFRQQGPFQQRSTQLLDASNRAWWPAQVRLLGFGWQGGSGAFGA